MRKGIWLLMQPRSGARIRLAGLFARISYRKTGTDAVLHICGNCSIVKTVKSLCGEK